MTTLAVIDICCVTGTVIMHGQGLILLGQYFAVYIKLCRLIELVSLNQLQFDQHNCSTSNAHSIIYVIC